MRADETHGPCPVTGAGEDACWWSVTDDGVLLIGCRKCSPTGGLDRAQFAAHAAALDLDAATTTATVKRKRRKRSPKSADLPDILQRVVGGVAYGTPGAAYLRKRGILEIPWCVRWMSRDDAWSAGIVPRCPDAAAGILIYLFVTPAAKCSAAQIEAVNVDAVRVLFPPPRAGGKWRKRPSVMGSRFGGGLAAFRPKLGTWTDLHICEGPIDAMALVALGVQGGIAGVPGTSAMRRAAVDKYTGPVTIWADGDDAGRQAALSMARDLHEYDVDVKSVAGDVAEELARRRDARTGPRPATSAHTAREGGST